MRWWRAPLAFVVGVIAGYVMQRTGWQRGADAAPRSHDEVSWLLVLGVGAAVVVLSQLRRWGRHSARRLGLRARAARRSD